MENCLPGSVHLFPFILQIVECFIPKRKLRPREI